MKYEDFVEFRNYLHSQKDVFELPKLPDTEWQYILSKSKDKAWCSVKKYKRSLLDQSVPRFLFSPYLAAVLTVTIFVLIFASYSVGLFQNRNKLNWANRTIQYKDKNTIIPVENVAYRVDNFGI